MDFNDGDKVRIEGERGTYKVHRGEPWKDGSILLYGGDSNPMGVRGFRAVMPSKLVVERRSQPIADRLAARQSEKGS